jgi:hypothetical protein
VRFHAVDTGVVIKELQILHDGYSKDANNVERFKKDPISKAMKALEKLNGELTEQWVDKNIQGPETIKKVKQIISLGYLQRNANMANSDFERVRQASHSWASAWLLLGLARHTK